MKTIHGIENFPPSEGSIVTIGTFDGVHLGHKQILKQLIDTSQQSKLKSVVLTFFLTPEWCYNQIFLCILSKPLKSVK